MNTEIKKIINKNIVSSVEQFIEAVNDNEMLFLSREHDEYGTVVHIKSKLIWETTETLRANFKIETPQNENFYCFVIDLNLSYGIIPEELNLNTLEAVKIDKETKWSSGDFKYLVRGYLMSKEDKSILENFDGQLKDIAEDDKKWKTYISNAFKMYKEIANELAQMNIWKGLNATKDFKIGIFDHDGKTYKTKNNGLQQWL